MTFPAKRTRAKPNTRKPKKPKEQKENSLNLELKEVVPLNDNQRLTFDYYEDGNNLLLTGTPGTGKTFLAMTCAAKSLFEYKEQNKIVIIRSTVQSRSMGYLPGTAKEKAAEFEAPYLPIFADLFGRADAYGYLKTKGVVEFMSTSFLRGITIKNAIVVVDEIQNLEWNEIFTIMTRLGENSRIIFCGDYKQSDLVNNFYGCTRKEEVLRLFEVIKKMSSFGRIEFGIDDIVRSGLVKEFIIANEKIE